MSEQRTELQPYDWHVPPTHENPVVAPQSNQMFPISESVGIIVTNMFANQRIDTWAVWEVNMVKLEIAPSQVLRFISSTYTQTQALVNARRYAWVVYRKDIAFADAPF
jgi:hypothetical protein